MNETTSSPSTIAPPVKTAAPAEHATVAGWTMGVSAVGAFITLLNVPTWPATVGVAVVMFTVACVCACIMKSK